MMCHAVLLWPHTSLTWTLTSILQFDLCTPKTPTLSWLPCTTTLSRPCLFSIPQVKEYIAEYQGHAWTVLSHHSSARYDQLASLQRAFTTVEKQPWNKVILHAPPRYTRGGS